MRRSAPARYAVKRTRQKIGNSNGHRFRPAPAFWAKFARTGKFSPQRLFSFGPCTARFLFSAQPKRENGGCIAQPSSWLKSTPPVRATTKPRPKGGLPPSRPRGADSEEIKLPSPAESVKSGEAFASPPISPLSKRHPSKYQWHISCRIPGTRPQSRSVPAAYTGT